MNKIIQLFIDHPYIMSSLSTWWSNFFISAFCNSLPAPTKDSGPLYIFFFRFCTYWLAQNPSRAKNNALESSPNYKDAINYLNNTKG